MAMIAAATSTIGHVKHQRAKRWWDEEVHRASLNKKRAHSAIREERKRGRDNGWDVNVATHPKLHGDHKRATKALKVAIRSAKAKERGVVIEGDQNVVHRMVAKGLGGGGLHVGEGHLELERACWGPRDGGRGTGCEGGEQFHGGGCCR